jgi:hypothetical protein
VKKALGERHPAYAQALNGLAQEAFDDGRLNEARALLEQAITIVQTLLRDDHPRLVTYRVNMARVQIASHEADKAEPALRHALDVRQHLYPSGDWRIAQVQSLLGASLAAQHRDDEAEPLMVTAAAVLQPIPGPQGLEEAANRSRLASLHDARDRARQTAPATR